MVSTPFIYGVASSIKSSTTSCQQKQHQHQLKSTIHYLCCTTFCGLASVFIPKHSTSSRLAVTTLGCFCVLCSLKRNIKRTSILVSHILNIITTTTASSSLAIRSSQQLPYYRHRFLSSTLTTTHSLAPP